jgi:hypothetical protein
MNKNNPVKLAAVALRRDTDRMALLRRKPFRIQVVSIIEDREISLYDKVVQLPLEVDQCDEETTTPRSGPQGTTFLRQAF